MKNGWSKIKWNGNPASKFMCWRKKFGRGHVSVGIGDFLTIVFSHGHDSEDSLSSTRWNYDNTPKTEQEAMEMIDRNHGFYNHKDPFFAKPANYDEWIRQHPHCA